MQAYGFNSGWANNCGTQLFTLGWVPCEEEVTSENPGGAKGYSSFRPLKGARDDDEILMMIARSIYQIL